MLKKKEDLINIFKNMESEKQDKVVSHLLLLTSISLNVFDANMKKIAITRDYSEAYRLAFVNVQRDGHFCTNTKLNFVKTNPSSVHRTRVDLFIDLIECLNKTPHQTFRLLERAQLIKDVE